MATTSPIPNDLSEPEITTDEAEQVANDFGKVAASPAGQGHWPVTTERFGVTDEIRQIHRPFKDGALALKLDPKALMKNAQARWRPSS